MQLSLTRTLKCHEGGYPQQLRAELFSNDKSHRSVWLPSLPSLQAMDCDPWRGKSMEKQQNGFRAVALQSYPVAHPAWSKQPAQQWHIF